MDSFSKVIFPKQLKMVRLELGLSQKEFALKVGRSPNTYNGWEKGTAFPSEAAIEMMVTVLGIRKDFLELGEGEMFSITN